MTAVLDARKMDEKTSAHEYLKRIFSFPDYYGNNLDALYDCLSEMNAANIIILHEDEAQNYYPKVLSVFEDLSDVKIYHIK